MKTINVGPTKVCPDCGEEKPLSDYFQSTSKRNSTWYSRRCKPCHNAYCREHRKTEHHKKVHKEWKLSDRGKEVVKNRMKNWRARNAEKRQAQSAISNGIRDKRIERKPCVICGSLKSEGHHPNYNNPTDVIWLCKKHHTELHYSWGEGKKGWFLAGTNGRYPIV